MRRSGYESTTVVLVPSSEGSKAKVCVLHMSNVVHVLTVKATVKVTGILVVGSW